MEKTERSLRMISIWREGMSRDLEMIRNIVDDALKDIDNKKLLNELDEMPIRGER